MTDRQINETIEAYMRTPQGVGLQDALGSLVGVVPKEYASRMDLLNAVARKIKSEGLYTKLLAELDSTQDSSPTRRWALAIAKLVRKER